MSAHIKGLTLLELHINNHFPHQPNTYSEKCYIDYIDKFHPYLPSLRCFMHPQSRSDRARPSRTGFTRYLVRIIVFFLFGILFVIIVLSLLIALQAHNTNTFFDILSSNLIFIRAVLAIFLTNPLLMGLLLLMALPRIVDVYLKSRR